MTSVEMRPPPARRAPADAREPTGNAEVARLYETYSDQLVRFCTRRLGARPEAEDAVQLTFLYALRALQRGVVPEAESAWLHAIAANVCRWQQRTRARRGPLSSDVDLDRIAAEAPGEDQRGLCRDLKDALHALPANQRRALVLREWHGLPSHEVAARLGMTTAATYALLTRARKSFVLAFEAKREAVLGLQLAALLHQFRGQLRALFGTASAKAVTVATVAAVGVGGVAVERSLESDRPFPRPRPAANEGVPAGSATPASVARPTATVDPVAGVTRPSSVPARHPGARVERVAEPSATVVVPPRKPREPDAAPAPESPPAPTGTPEPTTPSPEPVPVLPVDLPAPPEVDPPENELPSIDLPPVDLPPIELPDTDLPDTDLPTVDVPTVDVPPIDSSPVAVPELPEPPDLPGPL